MKLFRKIMALALMLVVIAMFGISASAASFRELNIFGDFGAGAIFDGYLTSNTITATAEFIPNSDNNILQDQWIRITYNFKDQRNNIYIGAVSEPTVEIENYLEVGRTLSTGYQFTTASYYYDAYYIANGVVDCYLSNGPQSLTWP